MNNKCPYCFEETKPAAKVCPHCRNWLSIFSLRNPVVGMVVVYMLFLIFIIGFLTFTKQLMNPGRDFSPYRDSISVVESRMNFQADQFGQAIYVVGVLTNKSELAWKNPQLDLRFYNQSGTLIDAASATVVGVIDPNGELAFRVKIVLVMLFRNMIHAKSLFEQLLILEQDLINIYVPLRSHY